MSDQNSHCELCSSRDMEFFNYYDYPLKDKFKNSIKKSINAFSGKKRFKTIQEDPIFKNVKLMKCSQCGFGSTYPKIGFNELKEFYSRNRVYSKKNKLKSINSVRPVKHYSYLIENIPKNSIKSVIDFGAAGAATGRHIALKNNLQNLASVEPLDSWHQLYKHSEVKIRPYHTIFDVNDRFSLLVGSHSLEFVEDLDTYINKMLQILDRVGYLFFEVPNCNDTWYKIKRKRVPATYFFSFKSIESLAKKYNLKIIHRGTFGHAFDEDDSQKTENTVYRINPEGRYLRFILRKN